MGGIASRRAGALSVLFVSQACALCLYVAVVAAAGLPEFHSGFLLWAVAAGLTEGTALAAFYRGLATGAMGVVAPISAVAGIVPFVVGLAGGDTLTTTHAAGAAMAMGGIVMTSMDSAEEAIEMEAAEVTESAEGNRRRIVTASGVGLALTAAAFFGLFFVTVDRAAEHGGTVWAVLVTRATLVVLVAVAFAGFGGRLPTARGTLGLVAIVGLFDISGTTLYALATTKGLLSVVGVLASAYPLITILLARFLLDERLGLVQRIGSVVTLAGVVLLTL
jgi:drug/metabolite transporter (DMT)-like permease